MSSQRGSGGQNANLLKRIIDQIEQRPLSAIDKWTRVSGWSLCEWVESGWSLYELED